MSRCSAVMLLLVAACATPPPMIGNAAAAAPAAHAFGGHSHEALGGVWLHFDEAAVIAAVGEPTVRGPVGQIYGQLPITYKTDWRYDDSLSITLESRSPSSDFRVVAVRAHLPSSARTRDQIGTHATYADLVRTYGAALRGDPRDGRLYVGTYDGSLRFDLDRDRVARIVLSTESAR